MPQVNIRKKILAAARLSVERDLVRCRHSRNRYAFRESRLRVSRWLAIWNRECARRRAEQEAMEEAYQRAGLGMLLACARVDRGPRWKDVR